MQLYLNRRGYFDAKVSYEVKYKKKTADINYNVNTGQIYTYNNIVVQTDNPDFIRILNENANSAFIKKGKAVDESVFQQEKLRIAKLFRNNGYAFFSPNMIGNLEGDSTGNQIDATYKILPPNDTVSQHQKFYIGDVFVFLNASADNAINEVSDSLVKGIHFYALNNDFKIKASALANIIYLKKGDLFQQDNYDKTSQQFVNYEIMRFFSIKPFVNPNSPDSIHFNIFLTTKKPIELNMQVDLSFSNLSYSVGNLIGTALNTSIKHKNFRKNAEIFIARLEGGIEFNPFYKEIPFINTLNINGLSEWNIPRFVDPFKLWQRFNTIPIIKGELYRSKNRFYTTLREKATTKFGIGYNYFTSINFYTYHSFNVNFGYKLPYSKNLNYEINQIGVNYLRPTFSDNFSEILENNIFLQRSFGKQLFTGFLFKDFSITYTKTPNLFGESWWVRGELEQSGLEVLGVNAITNIFRDSSKIFTIDNTEFAHFWKVRMEGRYTRKLLNNTIVAFRLATGLATPYGKFTRVVPYPRQFYLGGPNSIRAWRIRELGAGSYQNPESTNIGFPFYQAGDIMFEFNCEYRFDIFWRLKSALFIEGGNIWTLKTETARPGSKISKNFYKEIAIGTGIGWRFDFTFFVLRLDMGYKVRNPFKVNGSYWAYNSFDDLKFKDFNYNLAVGFPF